MTEREADPEAVALYLCCEALAEPALTPAGRSRVTDFLRTRFGVEGQLLEFLKHQTALMEEALRVGVVNRIPGEIPMRTIERIAAKGLEMPVAEVKALPKAKPVSNGKPVSRSTLTPEQLAEAKRLWVEGTMTATDIGKKFGKSTGWALVTAKNAGWPERGSAKKNGKPAGVERRCTGCGQRTQTNPCDHCFEKA